MNKPDFEFWLNLAKLQNLNEKIGQILKYSELEGVPLDLNFIEKKTSITAYANFAIKLEDQALDFAQLAETLTTYIYQMEQNLDEIENENLPDEGNPGFRIGE